ncbi:MAG: putative TIM-barrel fold metal-dependent hydrolase [Candidatus Latescibacterota bacterium]|jgi:predicted TIM-barrel fold metal-dependent hydrolase
MLKMEIINMDLPVCDPHFHLWNIHERPNLNLGDAVQNNLPIYLAEDYAQDMDTLPAPLKRVSGVHVETVVGQMEGGFPLDTVEETTWVCNQLTPSESQYPFAIVGHVNLAQDTAQSEALLHQHIEASQNRFRGVRMILNHHPDNPALTWPQVEHGAFLHDPLFSAGIALLGKHNLSFDLQCNPHQIQDAVNVFQKHPETRIIVNHLALLPDGSDEATEQRWHNGLKALSELPNVFMKLSMVFFAQKGYHQDPVKEDKIKNMVQEAIDLFGCNRCMFASNYPVDKLQGVSMNTLYSLFLKWTEDLSNTERTALFHDTAAQAYNLTSAPETTEQ